MPPLNPYDPPNEDPASETKSEWEPSFLERLAIESVLTLFSWSSFILFGLFVALLYWLGGKTAVYSVLVGIPIVFVITLLVLYFVFAETKEQQHEYLREKRRRMREEKRKRGQADSSQLNDESLD